MTASRSESSRAPTCSITSPTRAEAACNASCDVVKLRSSADPILGRNHEQAIRPRDALGVVAAGTLTAGALAVPPDHHTGFRGLLRRTSCGAFNDLYEGHLDASGITKFDKQGNPVSDVVHITGWERNWRSDRPSVSYTSKRSFTVHYDYATDTESDTGIIYQTTAPGHGVLFHDVGNIQFNDGTGEVIAIHGPHDVFEQGDAAYCNALLAIS